MAKSFACECNVGAHGYARSCYPAEPGIQALANVILSFGEESRYLCTPLSPSGRDKSEGVTHNMSF